MKTNLQYRDLKIDFNKELGAGYISKVYKATHRQTNQIYAVKMISLQKVSDKEKISLEREVKIHSRLSHPNIIKLYSSFTHENKLFLVLEYIEEGTLFDYLYKNNKIHEQLGV